MIPDKLQENFLLHVSVLIDTWKNILKVDRIRTTRNGSYITLERKLDLTACISVGFNCFKPFYTRNLFIQSCTPQYITTLNMLRYQKCQVTLWMNYQSHYHHRRLWRGYRLFCTRVSVSCTHIALCCILQLYKAVVGDNWRRISGARLYGWDTVSPLLDTPII